MVLVDAGKHLAGLLDTARGTQRPDEPDSRLAKLPPFYMDRLEITVAQYKNFDSGFDEKAFTEGRECPACPAMGIDWTEASRYCRWAGKRLPTEAEWIAAARGHSGNPWPWGNKYLPGRANLQGAGDGALFASPVGSYPKGASPFGALDMIGNVWEWVATVYSPPAGNNPPSKKKILRIVKGGGWTSDEKTARISFRNVVAPDIKNPTFGFRCVKPLGKKIPARRDLRKTTRD